MIPPKTVKEVIEVAKIEEVVGDYVNLKRRGVNMLGLCPFHNEKTPSFTVSPAKNLFKCFGCGKAGSPVNFVMEHENFSFPDAIRYLAKRYNIHVEEVVQTPEMKAEQLMEDSLYLINDFARDFYQKILFDNEQGRNIGLTYFKERAFREEIIKKFELGFALDGSDSLTKAALQAQYQLPLLKKLSLTSSTDRDFFRNRVIFPIHNLSGKVVAFAGRTLLKDAKIPKYINSPETEIYHKSKVLYGIHLAKNAIRKEDECILVEGYTDVISLHQAGIENVAASSGTSLTTEQIRLIKRYTNNIKILYDGDAAGIKAAIRGLDMVLEQDMNVKIVLLPNNEDPDSFAQKQGAEGFKQYIDSQAKDFILFKASLLMSEIGNDPIKKSKVIKDMVESIAKVPDSTKRSVFIRECSELLKVPEQFIIEDLNKLVKQDLKQTQQRRPARQGEGAPSDTPFPDLQPVGDEYEDAIEPTPKRQKTGTSYHSFGDEFKEKDLVRVLITGGNQKMEGEENTTIGEFLVANLQDVLEEFDNKVYQKVIHEYSTMLQKGEHPDIYFYTNHEDSEIRNLAFEVTMSEFEYSPGWEEKGIILQTQKMPEYNFDKDSIDIILKFKLRKAERLYERNQNRIKALAASNFEEVMHLLKVQQRLLEIRNDLAKKLNIVILK